MKGVVVQTVEALSGVLAEVEGGQTASAAVAEGVDTGLPPVSSVEGVAEGPSEETVEWLSGTVAEEPSGGTGIALWLLTE